MSLDAELLAALNERRELNRYRSRVPVQSPQQVEMLRDGCKVLNFCSNDYLGLANHPEVITAFKHAADAYGVGSGASHLVNGHSEEHHALEEELAEFTGRPRALLFSTGYMANMGVINALVGRGDAVFEDKLNHASLLDGGLLASADFIRFNHSDIAHLEQRLNRSEGKRKLIVTDGVFSMDGDLALLPQICELARQKNAHVMVDDAHGFGCLGENGKGVVSHFNLGIEEVPVLVGTLGKAFGTFGAFVAGSETLIESLIQFSRTYIYTTALPPAVAAATRASLKILKTENERREQLNLLVKQFREGCKALGLQLMSSESAVQPITIGSDQHALDFSEKLLKKGFWVSAIRPPTVPEGTARLRFTFTANHTAEQVNQLLDALNEVTKECDFENY